uniref:UDP-glucuronosyltransferase 2B2-like n=1 Tax=Drosophila rhopaloa TaxID=1041015 RepID=A0A6P4G208_DRORH
MVHKPSTFLFLAIAIATLVGGSQGANILGLFPSLSPSHLIIQMSAAKVLAEKGHNVTVVTVLEPVVTHKNIHLILVPLTKEEAQLMSDGIGSMSKSDNRNMALSMLQALGQIDFIFKKNAEILDGRSSADLYLNKDNQFDVVLSGNMADFLGNATDGAILLSLGSNVKGSHLKPDTVVKIFNVLSKLKQRVIWKWEDLEKTPGKSDNILYSKWLPQDDILAHPKIKLFINHAGKGGITEAQYHGKPMLSLPVFGDQPGNANEMVQKGFGLTLSLLSLEEPTFREAIMEILSNPQYTQKVASFSSLYRDRPMTARESVVYWTEYVIRHHGAAHLQSPLVHMNWIAANNIDIYFLFAFILIISILLLKTMVKFILRKFFSKSKKQKKH